MSTTSQNVQCRHCVTEKHPFCDLIRKLLQFGFLSSHSCWEPTVCFRIVNCLSCSPEMYTKLLMPVHTSYRSASVSHAAVYLGNWYNAHRFLAPLVYAWWAKGPQADVRLTWPTHHWCVGQSPKADVGTCKFLLIKYFFFTNLCKFSTTMTRSQIMWPAYQYRDILKLACACCILSNPWMCASG